MTPALNTLHPCPRVLSTLGAALCLLLGACGGGGGTGEPTPLPAFRVTSTTPTAGSTRVDLVQTVWVRFSKALDPSTVGAATISVASVSGTGTAGTVLLEAGGDVLRWVPLFNMAEGEEHVVTLDPALRSVDGEALAAAFTLRFVTAFPSADPLPTADQMKVSLGKLQVGRQGHAATLLDDGRVLVTGGFTVGGATTDTAEVYFEAVQQFVQLGGRMARARASHTATLLADGRVLLAGGWFEGAPGINATTAAAEVFDPVTDTFSAVGDMTSQRADHAALRLPDGRVLLTGGSRLVGSFLEDLDTAEVFDPVTNTFTALAERMTHTRATHGMVPGGPGKFVLAGGSDADLGHGWCDLATLTFEDLGAAVDDRARFGPAVAAFQSGGVVIAGGDTLGTVLYVSAGTGFVQNTGSGLNRARSYATATRIKPDQVLVAGGIDFSRGGFIESSCDVVVEGGIGGSNTYAAAVRFTTGMAFHAAACLPSGDILFCGGLNEDGSQPNKTATFLFDVR